MLTELIGWRTVFLVNLPLCLAAVVLARVLTESRDRAAAHLDLPGMAIVRARRHRRGRRHALLEDGHTGRTHPLTGPHAIAPAEKVRTIGQVIGRDPALELDSATDHARDGEDEISCALRGVAVKDFLDGVGGFRDREGEGEQDPRLPRWQVCACDESLLAQAGAGDDPARADP